MGANNNKQRKSSSCLFSIFNAFKGRDGGRSRSRRDDNYVMGVEDASAARRVWPSDEDKGRHWVAEPGIDRKAKAYIDRIHQIRVSETECHSHNMKLVHEN